MADQEEARPRPWVWLAIAASAIAGTVKMVTRPDLDPSDLILPIAYTGVLVGTLLAVRFFWPQALRNPDRNAGLLIGFMIGMLSVILLFAFDDLL